jgi:hypothetical protein
MKFAGVLNLGVLDERLPKPEATAFMHGKWAGTVWGLLTHFPESEVRENVNPDWMNDVLSEVVLRMGEATNREVRTEPSVVFKDWLDVVYEPCDPVPEWLEARAGRFR